MLLEHSLIFFQNFNFIYNRNMADKKEKIQVSIPSFLKKSIAQKAKESAEKAAKQIRDSAKGRVKKAIEDAKETGGERIANWAIKKAGALGKHVLTRILQDKSLKR